MAAAEVQLFAKQYRRKAQKDTEPNDRKYNRKVESKIKRMQPEKLDLLLRLDDK